MVFGGVFSGLDDRRRAQGKRYALEPLLCSIVMSLMAGANSLRTIEVFIAEGLIKGHGRIDTRTVRTWDVPPKWLDEDWQALVSAGG